MLYFETIIDASVFSARRPPSVKDINEMRKIPAGSKWSTDELFAARLLVRASRADSERGHVLPALREHLDGAATARRQPQIRALLEVPDQSDHHRSLTETELVHLHGASLGSFWAALARFGDVEGLDIEIDGEDHGEGHGQEDGEDDDIAMETIGEGEKRPYSSGSDISASALPVAQTKRVRTERVRQDFASSTTMQVGSSSPAKSSQQASECSSAGYVSQAHAVADVPEQATVQIASAFIRHVLQACPPQDNTRLHKPTSLVEFSGASRELVGDTAQGARIRATSDGELVLYRLNNHKCYSPTSHRLALLEAKKRFNIILDGQLVLANNFLGQMTCEALALRLHQAEDVRQVDEK
jgi:hypothetical protein